MVWPPYWHGRPYPASAYWPGYRPLAAPWPITGPWSPYAFPANTGLNRWQVYGGMDQSGGVWMAFVYRGHVSHLLSGDLFGNGWLGSGLGINTPPNSDWRGASPKPPAAIIFEDPVWDNDNPA